MFVLNRCLIYNYHRWIPISCIKSVYALSKVHLIRLSFSLDATLQTHELVKGINERTLTHIHSHILAKMWQKYQLRVNRIAISKSLKTIINRCARVCVCLWVFISPSYAIAHEWRKKFTYDILICCIFIWSIESYDVLSVIHNFSFFFSLSLSLSCLIALLYIMCAVRFF